MEEKELTEIDYVNSQRVCDLLVHGPIEDIYNTVDLVNEYSVIKEKKSKLSADQRKRVVSIYEVAVQKYNEDLTNGDRKHWNNTQKLLKYSEQVLNKLKNYQSTR